MLKFSNPLFHNSRDVKKLKKSKFKLNKTTEEEAIKIGGGLVQEDKGLQ